jgi:chromosome segregation protein
MNDRQLSTVRWMLEESERHGIARVAISVAELRALVDGLDAVSLDQRVLVDGLESATHERDARDHELAERSRALQEAIAALPPELRALASDEHGAALPPIITAMREALDSARGAMETAETERDAWRSMGHFLTTTRAQVHALLESTARELWKSKSEVEREQRLTQQTADELQAVRAERAEAQTALADADEERRALRRERDAAVRERDAAIATAAQLHATIARVVAELTAQTRSTGASVSPPPAPRLRARLGDSLPDDLFPPTPDDER